MVSSLGNFFSTSIVNLSVYDVFVLLVFIVALILTIIFSLIIVATKVRKLNSDLNDQSNAQIASNKAILDNLDIVVSHLEHNDHVSAPKTQQIASLGENYKKNSNLTDLKEDPSSDSEHAEDIDEEVVEYLGDEDDQDAHFNQTSTENKDSYEDHVDENSAKNKNARQQDIIIKTEGSVPTQAEILPKPMSYKLPAMALNIINDNEDQSKRNNVFAHMEESHPRTIPITKSAAASQKPLVVTSSLPQLSSSTTQHPTNVDHQYSGNDRNIDNLQNPIGRPFNEIHLPSISNYADSVNNASLGGGSVKDKVEQMRAKLNNTSSSFSPSASRENIARLREKLNANKAARNISSFNQENGYNSRNNNLAEQKILPMFNKGKEGIKTPLFAHRAANVLANNKFKNSPSMDTFAKSSNSENKIATLLANRLKNNDKTKIPNFLANREERRVLNSSRPLGKGSFPNRPTVIANIKRPTPSAQPSFSRLTSLKNSGRVSGNTSRFSLSRGDNNNSFRSTLLRKDNNSNPFKAFLNSRNNNSQKLGAAISSLATKKDTENSSSKTLAGGSTKTARRNINTNNTERNSRTTKADTSQRITKRRDTNNTRATSRTARSTRDRANVTSRNERNERSSRRRTAN